MTYAAAITTQRMNAFRKQARRNALALPMKSEETKFESFVLNVIGWVLGY
jgi:hypothetical protein